MPQLTALALEGGLDERVVDFLQCTHKLLTCTTTPFSADQPRQLALPERNLALHRATIAGVLAHEGDKNFVREWPGLTVFWVNTNRDAFIDNVGVQLDGVGASSCALCIMREERTGHAQ